MAINVEAARLRLRDAISGERRYWHKVEVAPDDIAATLDAVPLDYSAVRKAITDSYYDTRNEGGTMETAADLAATRVMNLLSQRLASPEPREDALRAAVANYLQDHDEGYDPRNLEGCWCDGKCIGVRNLRAAIQRERP